MQRTTIPVQGNDAFSIPQCLGDSQDGDDDVQFGSIFLVTGVLCAAGGALAADGAKHQVIPNFATTDKTGWVLDHAFGVDDLLPPPSGGPGPVTFDKAHPYVPNNFGAQSTYRVADLPIRSCSPGPSSDEEGERRGAGGQGPVSRA